VRLVALGSAGAGLVCLRGIGLPEDAAVYQTRIEAGEFLLAVEVPGEIWCPPAESAGGEESIQ